MAVMIDWNNWEQSRNPVVRLLEHIAVEHRIRAWNHSPARRHHWYIAMLACLAFHVMV
jgi:hypothetical protein